MVLDASLSDAKTPESLRFRTPTEGNETTLVQAFVDNGLTTPPRAQLRTTFIEPAIETGYPDIVIAYANHRTVDHWSPARARLQKQDLRVLHLLSASGPWEGSDLFQVGGSGTSASLERLVEADLVYRRATVWYARSLRDTFALRRLIAVEAKMDDWRDGLRQAVKNTWFASESYLLLPSSAVTSAARSEADAMGVGLLVPEASLARPLLKPRKGDLPRSYASWLFNEWTCRARRSQQ